MGKNDGVRAPSAGSDSIRIPPKKTTSFPLPVELDHRDSTATRPIRKLALPRACSTIHSRVAPPSLKQQTRQVQAEGGGARSSHYPSITNKAKDNVIFDLAPLLFSICFLSFFLFFSCFSILVGECGSSLFLLALSGLPSLFSDTPVCV